MWVEVKKAKTLAIAEMWKECFEGEGIPARIMPVAGLPIGQEIADLLHHGARRTKSTLSRIF